MPTNTSKTRVLIPTTSRSLCRYTPIRCCSPTSTALTCISARSRSTTASFTPTTVSSSVARARLQACLIPPSRCRLSGASRASSITRSLRTTSSTRFLFLRSTLPMASTKPNIRALACHVSMLSATRSLLWLTSLLISVSANLVWLCSTPSTTRLTTRCQIISDTSMSTSSWLMACIIRTATWFRCRTSPCSLISSMCLRVFCSLRATRLCATTSTLLLIHIYI